MKKICILLLCAISLFSCKKSLLDIGFDVSQTTNFAIPASTPLTLLNLVSPTVNANWQQSFSNNNADRSKIQSVKLTSLQLTITSPPGQTFAFLKSIAIYISAPGLSEVEIAQKDNILSNTGSVLSLDVDNVDLSAYAKQDNFTLRFSTTTNQANSSEVDVRADMNFHIVANPLK